MTDAEDTDAISRELEDLVYDGLAEYDNGRARSQQSAARVLGMSDLGGCREFMRASIAGDPKKPARELKWAAFCGTAIGDLAEKALAATRGAKTQRWVTVQLESGIEVSGSTDATVLGNRLLDFKTKDRLDEVVDSGPSYKQWVQVSGYLIGMIQAGEMPADSTASLVFLDRSGAQPRPVVFTITEAQARSYLEDADERLEDVAKALATDRSQGELRDEPESWCWHVACPFFDACWGPDYQGQGVIDAPQHIAAMEKYDRGRRLEKKGDALKRQAKTELGAWLEADPPEGEGGGWRLKWTLSDRGRFISRTIDLRAVGPRKPKAALPQAEVDAWAD